MPDDDTTTVTSEQTDYIDELVAPVRIAPPTSTSLLPTPWGPIAAVAPSSSATRADAVPPSVGTVSSEDSSRPYSTDGSWQTPQLRACHAFANAGRLVLWWGAAGHK